MSRFLPLIVFFVVLLGTCAPRFAHASCGDWLQHPSPFEVVVPVDAAESRNADERPAPAKPCSGPLCRQSPIGPEPLPVSPTIERHHHDAAWVRLSAAANESRNSEWFVADGLFLQTGHKMGIERPPRS